MLLPPSSFLFYTEFLAINKGEMASFSTWVWADVIFSLFVFIVSGEEKKKTENRGHETKDMK